MGRPIYFFDDCILYGNVQYIRGTPVTSKLITKTLAYLEEKI